MVRVKEFSQVKPGDFVYHQRVLEIVRAIEFTEDTIRVTLESDQVLEIHPGDNAVFYSVKPKLP
ncbi:MAG TPA: hypothetical protein VGD92_05850 [Sphingobacteriaceae bacterium]